LSERLSKIFEPLIAPKGSRLGDKRNKEVSNTYLKNTYSYYLKLTSRSNPLEAARELANLEACSGRCSGSGNLMGRYSRDSFMKWVAECLAHCKSHVSIYGRLVGEKNANLLRGTQTAQSQMSIITKPLHKHLPLTPSQLHFQIQILESHPQPRTFKSRTSPKPPPNNASNRVVLARSPELWQFSWALITESSLRLFLGNCLDPWIGTRYSEFGELGWAFELERSSLCLL